MQVKFANRLAAVVALSFLAAFSTCASAQSGNVYGENQLQAVSSAQEGVVLQVALKQAQASWQARTGGATGGGLVGALIGSSLGGDSQTNTLLSALGALGGGFAGERLVNANATNDAQEIVIGIKDPNSHSISRVITVVQPAPFDSVVVNDNVLVINTNGTYRVIRRTYNTASIETR